MVPRNENNYRQSSKYKIGYVIAHHATELSEVVSAKYSRNTKTKFSNNPSLGLVIVTTE